MEIMRIIAWVQAVYFGITGLWPLIHMPSFLAVTGPKTDLWLVRTVGLLVMCVAVALAVASCRGDVDAQTIALALPSSVALAGIDVVYVAKRVIAKIYLIDAAAECALVIAWMIALALGH
jgi:hypothetical protein